MPSTTDPRTKDDLSQAGESASSADTAHGGARDHVPAGWVQRDTENGARHLDATLDDGGVDHTPVRLIDPDGTRHEVPELDRWLDDVDDAAMLGLYTDMVAARRIDTEATALQRQGQLGLWPPMLGQEAAQIGSSRALREDDFVFSSYREQGVAYVRGIAPTDLLRVWRGAAPSGWDPYEYRMAPMQVIIGAQTLHAVGYAVGLLLETATAGTGAHGGIGISRPENDGPDAPERTSATISYFGDGATSQGDVHEAMTFASTWSAPTVFFCQNNQWAISEPVDLQSKVPLVERARGYGMPGVRVDGNDVLAVLAVTREALQRARAGLGPTFIEAVTYRMGPHTTADDPTRYRDRSDLEEWSGRDPIARLAAHLRDRGVLDDDAEAAVQQTADEVAATMRAGVYAVADPDWSTVFDHVYAEPHAVLDAERDAYGRYLAGFADNDTQEAAR